MQGPLGWMLGLIFAWGCGLRAFGAPPDPAVERGSRAMTETGYLKPAWDENAYRRTGPFWGEGAPDPDTAPEAYAAAFNRRYGLHPAPYPNDGLPMGLRRGAGPDGSKTGLAIDCLVCHGGSIGGTSYVGLGNSTLDLKTLFDDMNRAEGRRAPTFPYVVNSVRGAVNAGMFSATLLSMRNADMSRRQFPLPLGANLPELDVPAWWLLGKKSTMYYDGRTDARSVRTNMQFILGESSLEELKDLEPTFRDIQAWLKSLKPPKYPFPIDAVRADRGEVIFEKTCAKCHGTYGPNGRYHNVIVELKVVGTDPRGPWASPTASSRTTTPRGSATNIPPMSR